MHIFTFSRDFEQPKPCSLCDLQGVSRVEMLAGDCHHGSRDGHCDQRVDGLQQLLCLEPCSHKGTGCDINIYIL